MTSTTFPCVSKHAEDLCKQLPPYCNPSFCLSPPIEPLANNVCVPAAMTTTTIATIATEAMLHKSITPTMFLLGFYGETTLFQEALKKNTIPEENILDSLIHSSDLLPSFSFTSFHYLNLIDQSEATWQTKTIHDACVRASPC